ncbi:MAG: CBS domain-containing protein [Blastocatellales bacterium]
MAARYSTRDDYGRYGYDMGYERSERDRGRGYYGGRGREDRGFFERAGDELRSWFGDEDAQRRPSRDEYETERRYRQGEYWRPQRSEYDLRAGDIMSRNVVTVFPDDLVERAAQLMRNCDCGALPVTDANGQMIGLVTDRDITVRLVARGLDTQDSIVADCMTDEAFSCHANDCLEDCMRQMSRRQVRRMPIVNDGGQIIGIISQSDIARYAEAYRGRGERRRFADMVSEISQPSATPYR